MKPSTLYLATFVILLSIHITATAQSSNTQRGKTIITGDTRVSQLVQKHIELNERVHTIQGFRIQVASLSGTDSKRKAFELRDRLRETYTTTESYVIFDEPNFKVRIGDFRTRLEAFAFLNQMKNIFPGTIIKDNIYATPFLWEDSEDDGDED